ncbi:MAG TPA: tellurite resistance TerB family protein [Leptospiraceae bacterium]|nr:tellurite resistance TerB family protein [Leptospiraceae bacterium]HMY67481.1 tellurite resistance TerB family protein [Leptospiraceae bacterium]HMZ59551.1 tellurite resistance TerB family protein [Leptospiraceae bacterium]HNF14134.1 tellurite resistance TerB family protein [Leptospiraceae bacterium]HNF23094.1 tellurite resistance TerB family protein [Leptospiraceae bacterium]
MAKTLPKIEKKAGTSFSPAQAMAAIGLISMAADSHIDPSEVETLIQIVQRIDEFKEYSEKQMQDLLNTITNISQTDGNGVLLGLAADALSTPGLKEAALKLAFLVVAADGNVVKEEEQFLTDLQNVLGISNDRYDEILKQLFGQ